MRTTTTLHTPCVLFHSPGKLTVFLLTHFAASFFSVGDQEGHSSKRITLGPNAQVTHWSASLLQRFMGIHLVFTALRSISFSPILRFLKMNRCNLKFHKLSYRVIYQWKSWQELALVGFQQLFWQKRIKIVVFPNLNWPYLELEIPLIWSFCWAPGFFIIDGPQGMIL